MPHHKTPLTSKRLLQRLLLSIVAATLALGVLPVHALAANENTDITLGAFFTSEEDVSDVVYASYDGETFYAIDTAYQDATPNDSSSLIYMDNHSTHKDPSIMYWNGYFWMLSGMNCWDGKFWPVISYSKDLKTWTHPEADRLLRGASTHGVALDSLPVHNGRPLNDFAVVAPKFHVTDKGELYITFCAGYYGAFWGQPMHDEMQVYTCKIDELSADDPYPIAETGNKYAWPNNLVFRAETAQKVGFSNYSSANYIDSNMYSEGNATYLLAKKDGLIEQIYRSTTPNDPNSWSLVNERASFGYEGVSINKANGTYYLYGDGVWLTKPLGVRAVTSPTINRSDEWSDARSGTNEKLHDLAFIAEDGSGTTARHGQAITLKAGTPEWQTVKALLDKKLVQGGTPVYRLYNQYDHYRLYTTDVSEYENLVSAGWNGEGIAWQAPQTSNAPVYRLYNRWTGDHLWTTSPEEYDHLETLGWNKEGVTFHSDDAKGVAVRRFYNPWITGRGSSHHYTADPTEQATMLRNGWLDDGESSTLYGLAH